MSSSIASSGYTSSMRSCLSHVGNVGCSHANSSRRTCPAFVNISSSIPTSPRQFSSMEFPAKSSSLASSRQFICSREGNVPSLTGTRELLTCHAQTEGLPPMSDAEQEGWEQRQKEAAADETSSDPFQWRWTLNWDSITPNIIVGSCPRSPGDIDRMVDEAGIDAVLNLQSDLCFDALKIPYDAIRNRAVERGIRLERVAIRDFDHADQSLMLPVAVRLLNSLLARGMKVYVHCTAGINRATLTTVGHLTFVQQMDLDDAVTMVKSARPVAHPYIDCWTEVRRRLLDGRLDEVTGTSEQIYEARLQNGTQGTKNSDWWQAEKLVISQTFQRYLETDLAMIDMETAWLKRRFELEHMCDGVDGGGANGSVRQR